ncbi:MAG: peptidoglycan DD-metalloendopeptidase family protein [Kiloniellaceae bacterium]
MNKRRPWTAAVVLAATGLLLSACLAPPSYRPVGFVTPKDPPGLPQRKPPPPADFAAWEAPLETAAAAVQAEPGVIDVEVQQLAPQAVSERALEPQLLPAAKPVRQGSVQQASLQTAAAAPAGGGYVVAQGDSLYGIARRFGLPIRAVIDANRMQPPYALRIGQRLAIPDAQVHEVAPGDTVFNIAQRYNVDRSELVRLNGIEAPYSIPLGQKLILPTPDSAAEPAAMAVAYNPAPDTALAAESAPPPAAEAPQPARSTAARSTAATRAALAKLPPRAGATFLWPVQGTLLSPFGAKEGGEHNDGINIAAPRGTTVRAAENGVVAYAGDELKGFGKLLLVKHDGGWVTAYAHNDDLLVGPGDSVRRGQSIARVGSSGNVDRPQLHFEVRRGTKAVNPETQLAPRTASASN